MAPAWQVLGTNGVRHSSVVLGLALIGEEGVRKEKKK
jgi:hypothetical protein